MRARGAVLFNWVSVDRVGAITALNTSPDLTPGEPLEVRAGLSPAA